MSGTARPVEEVRLAGPVPLWSQPEWATRFPWLVQATTGAHAPEGGEDTEAGAPFDLGLFGTQPVGAAMSRWRSLRHALGMPNVATALQVHAADLAVHETAGPPGLHVGAGVDGHLTRRAGLLLAVSVADCVPVSVVDAERRAVAMLHAGWRGAAAGILERALKAMASSFGSRAADVHVHLGPAICGACYEVGPEVHRAVRPGRDAPAGPAPIDLRGALADRAAAAGVPAAQLTVSTLCTRCGGSRRGSGPADFFSHRGGRAERQMGVLGIRPPAGEGLQNPG